MLKQVRYVERLASIQVERSDKTFKPARVGLNVVSLVFVKIIFSQIQDTADQHFLGQPWLEL